MPYLHTVDLLCFQRQLYLPPQDVTLWSDGDLRDNNKASSFIWEVPNIINWVKPCVVGKRERWHGVMQRKSSFHYFSALFRHLSHQQMIIFTSICSFPVSAARNISFLTLVLNFLFQHHIPSLYPIFINQYIPQKFSFFCGIARLWAAVRHFVSFSNN